MITGKHLLVILILCVADKRLRKGEINMKNKILKAITGLSGVTFTLGVCCLDSVSNIPSVVCLVSSGWIVSFMGVNWDYLVRHGYTIK